MTDAIRAFISRAAWSCRLAPEVIFGRGGPGPITRARHAIIWAVRAVFRVSFPLIGAAMGRDSSTIVDAFHRADARTARDPEFAALCARLCRLAQEDLR